ncbi:c-type cytochrome, partial [Mariniblastus sp.]|nr:c-type cytochrome [Mariniblastus sp.]
DEPEILLDGFENSRVRHNIVNGLRWGPDGWLYGRHGIMATSFVGRPGATESQRSAINCGIWRYHPKSKVFEVVAHGGTNPWGFDFDQHGEMFMINTVIGHLFHVVPGARYSRMSGAHFNPHTYQVIPQTADHVHWDTTKEKWSDAKKNALSDETDKAGGGHAHCGLMIYQGDNWPQEFRNKLFTANFHGRRLNSEILERHGNGYVAVHGPDYFKTADPWFRGIELLTGPDGGVFVLDWSDIGECHENDGVHRTSGRIFKLVYGDHQSGDLKKLPAFDIATNTLDELIIKLMHPNQWFARKARRRLQELSYSDDSVIRGSVQAQLRAFYHLIDAKAEKTSGKTSGGRIGDMTADEANQSASRQLNEAIAAGKVRKDWELNRLSLLWACFSCEALSTTELIAVSESSDEHARAWAVRMMTDGRYEIGDAMFERIHRMAGTDDSGLVRLYLASSLNRMSADQAFRLTSTLASYPTDKSDSMQPHLLWYGIEPFVLQDPEAAIELAIGSKIQLLRENIARRITGQLDSNPELVEKLLVRFNSADVPSAAFARKQCLIGMAKALEGWNQAKEPTNWKAFAESLDSKADPVEQKLVQKLNLLFGDQVTLEDLFKTMQDRNASVQARRQAIETIGRLKPDQRFFEVAQKLIGKTELTHSVLRGMARLDQAEIPSFVLKKFSAMDPQARKLAIDLLSGRLSYARQLLIAIEKNRIPVSMLTASHARRMAGFEDPKLNEQLKQVWGTVRSSSAEKLEQIKRLREKLTEEAIASADIQVGRKLFQENCASCHVMRGQGGAVGPDLTGADRKNLNYLLENIVDPSSSVADSFRSSNVLLLDGRLLIGVVIKQSKKTLTLQTKDGVVTIDQEDVDQTKQTQLSLMPEGLLDQMNDQQRATLFKYLQN